MDGRTTDVSSTCDDVASSVCMYGWMDGWMDVRMYVHMYVCMQVYTPNSNAFHLGLFRLPLSLPYPSVIAQSI